ncbi:MAG: carboxypeptidase regulatory-like domain-containing protein [Bryobacterales bacterium]|nr:carboxypeptidase regulatory-like domain-containing protein [Bryobacterales bacterium]
MTPFRVGLILLVAVCALSAQTITGTIVGTVTDSAGAFIPGAEVILEHVTTRAIRNVQTSDAGDFVAGTLAPGQYRITVKMQGFKSAERTGVILTAAERLSVGALTLEIGAVEEKITVVAQGATVQTASAEKSAAITSSQIDQLLVRGRSVTALLGLLPGVVDPQEGNIDTPTATSNFNVNGSRNNTNNFTMDGVVISAPGGAANLLLPVSMDAVSEVKVMLSNFQAEYGRLSGATVQMISKSGTRSFHGLGSYFKRHEQFNATDFFRNFNGLQKGRYRFNTWTYNIGGPVYIPGRFNRNREKLFFFWSHEYWPNKTTSALQTSTLPTELERLGDFSQSVEVNGAIIPVRDPLNNRNPFPNNIVPTSRIDRNGQVLLNFFPTPNAPDRNITRGNYNYATQWESTNPSQLITAKIDHLISIRDTVAGSYNIQRITGSSFNGGGLTTVPFAALPTRNNTTNHAFSLRHQHIFSPSLTVELTFGFVKNGGPIIIDPEDLKKLQRGPNRFTAGQLNPAANPLDLLPGMSFGGIVGAGALNYDGRFPYDLTRDNADFAGSIGKVWGGHTFKAGAFYQFITQYDGTWANNFTGRFDFSRNVNNPLDTNHPFANAALGLFSNYIEATSRPISDIRAKGLEWYVQDNWKVTRRLTLDVGLRFYWFTPFYVNDNRLAGFALDRFDPARAVRLLAPALSGGARVARHPVTGQTYPAALIGAIAPNTGNETNGMLIASETPGYPRALMNNVGPALGPRAGFAWDPFGTGVTAVRGGFGIFYNRFLGYAFNAVNSFPIVQTPVINYDSLSTFRSAQGFQTPPSVIAWDRNMKAPTVMNMSLSFQRQIGFGTVLDAGYVGSLGRNLWWEQNLGDVPLGARFDPRNADPTNPRIPLPDVFLRPIPGYSDVALRDAAGTSNYHSLQATMNRRFTKKLEFGGSWTWSKAMDYVDGDQARITTIVSRRVWNYGLAGFDRTHIFKLNWLWELPKTAWNHPAVRLALNDWQLNGIASFVSGAPVSVGYSLVNAADITGTPSLGARIVISGNPVLPKSERNFYQNFRTDVFRAPAVGTIGNAARTNLRGPGINNWDVALFKNIPIQERLKLQFRAEFYNAFNHTQFSAYDAAARFDAQGRQVNTRFGQFTAARTPRIAQLALRVSF